MGYEKINSNEQFNFQANRVLTYGEEACHAQKIRAAVPGIRTLADWHDAWLSLAKDEEKEENFLHAAYAYRMVEFFLTSADSEKDAVYQKCLDNFYRGFAAWPQLCLERYEIPFEGKLLYCIRIAAQNSRGTILVCGGYDSFIEEFVLPMKALTEEGYTILLMEGPGQGRCLREKLCFRYDFEKPVSAVLNYFEIENCAMVGISWGGYFALRSAAFEKRITAAAAYDVMDDGLEVMTHVFPKPVEKILRAAFRRGNYRLIDRITGMIRKKSVLADWALSQGMHITGTSSAGAFYENISRHTLSGITDRLTQDILLLAGEKDHYIPLGQYERLKDSISNARTLTCRLFTEEEGGGRHCQIGNHMLAVRTIVDWLDGLHVSLL